MQDAPLLLFFNRGPRTRVAPTLWAYRAPVKPIGTFSVIPSLPAPIERLRNIAYWDRVYSIPAEELWRTHERRRERLVVWARKQRLRHGAREAEIEAANEIPDPAALIIGFARRFATYKRAALIVHDLSHSLIRWAGGALSNKSLT